MCDECDKKDREIGYLKDEIKTLRDEIRWARHDGFVIGGDPRINAEIKLKFKFTETERITDAEEEG